MLRLTALLALIAALALAGCGGDDDDTDETQARASETAPTPAQAREALKETSSKPEIPRPSGSPPRRLEKEDIVRGKGRAARAGDSLTVHYAGVTFSTGEEFDASWNAGQPYTFALGAGEVIEGWDRGVVGMKEGGRRKLTIPPELAYGAQGSEPPIGPNETLVFVVDVLDIQ